MVRGEGYYQSYRRDSSGPCCAKANSHNSVKYTQKRYFTKAVKVVPANLIHDPMSLDNGHEGKEVRRLDKLYIIYIKNRASGRPQSPRSSF